MQTEDRLIDSNEVEKALVSVKEWFTGDQCTEHDKLAQAVVKMCIEEVKKIKPAEVVRCKDCENAQKYCGGLYCKFYEQTMDENDFCSHGERRTDNG